MMFQTTRTHRLCSYIEFSICCRRLKLRVAPVEVITASSVVQEHLLVAPPRVFRALEQQPLELGKAIGKQAGGRRRRRQHARVGPHERAHRSRFVRVARDAMYPSVAYFVGDHRQLRPLFVQHLEEVVEGGSLELPSVTRGGSCVRWFRIAHATQAARDLSAGEQLLNGSPGGLVPTKTTTQIRLAHATGAHEAAGHSVMFGGPWLSLRKYLRASCYTKFQRWNRHRRT